MADFDNNIQALLREFANITVDIKVKETWRDDINHPIYDGEVIVNFPKIWDFILTFNREFKVESDSINGLKQKAFLSYHKLLEEEKSNAYKEIDNFILSCNSLLEVSNYLSTLKLKFEEVLLNYFIVSDEKRTQYYKLLDNEIINRSISENKSIDYLFEKQLVHEFLLFQKTAIVSTLNYIITKIALIEKKQGTNKEVVEELVCSPIVVMPKVGFLNDTNILLTLFYDLFTEGYLKISKTDLERFIYNSFTDKDGNPLSKETIHTILKPGREEKRALDDKRIKVPKRN